MKIFFEETEVQLFESWEAGPWAEIMADKGREVWAHEGLCSCGRKTYLFGQCSKCLKNEAQLKHEAVLDDLDRQEAALRPGPAAVAAHGRPAARAASKNSSEQNVDQWSGPYQEARADWEKLSLITTRDVSRHSLPHAGETAGWQKSTREKGPLVPSG